MTGYQSRIASLAFLTIAVHPLVVHLAAQSPTPEEGNRALVTAFASAWNAHAYQGW